jgi:beta-glucosidase-like glycosyl hydrolase
MKILMIFQLFLSFAFANERFTKELEDSNDLKIPKQECAKIENKLGQLFYANVDGYGLKTGAAIDPAYIKMVQDLQLGGVLPHPGAIPADRQLAAMREDYAKLQKVSTLPLMIGVDIHRIQRPTPETPSQNSFNSSSEWGTGENEIKFGLGVSSGLLSKHGSKSTTCLSEGAFLDAFFHRVVGLNQSLGPTVENNPNFPLLRESADVVRPKIDAALEAFNQLGVATTMKHFPYTPTDFDLHKKSEDTKIPLARVKEMLSIFKDIGNETDFAMSTHIFNSNVDADDMATFSEKWIKILREDLKFNGILMTDGLFMITHYPASVQSFVARWPQDQVYIGDTPSIFALRAILAGHDMVLVEGASNSTYIVFKNVLKVACSDKPVGQQLRNRIFDSYARIVNWKKAHSEQLLQRRTIPDDLIEEARQLYNQSCPDPDKFKQFKAKVENLKFVPMHNSAPMDSTQQKVEK